MRNDNLLRALAALERESREPTPSEQRWEALARGHLPDEHGTNVASVERSTQADARRMDDIFKPFDAGTRDRMAQGILAMLETEADAASRPAGLPDPLPPNVIPFRRRSALRVVALLAPLVAAAMLMLYVVRPADGLAFPEYTLALSGGDQALRAGSEAPGLPRLAPGSTLALTLRPASPAPGTTVRAFRNGPTGQAALPTQPMPSADGAFALRGPARTVLGADDAGTYELLFIIAPAGAPPQDEEFSALVGATAAGQAELARVRGWQVLRAPIVITPEP